MRKISIVAIMGLCFVAGIAFVYSCGGGSSSSAGTIGELEDRVLALENKLTPAYDSGWRDIAQGEQLFLEHNLGGNMDDYLIDVTQRWNTLPNFVHKYYPGDLITGVYWNILPPGWGDTHNTTIRVYRGSNNSYADQVRVRIWNLGS